MLLIIDIFDLCLVSLTGPFLFYFFNFKFKIVGLFAGLHIEGRDYLELNIHTITLYIYYFIYMRVFIQKFITIKLGGQPGYKNRKEIIKNLKVQ